MKKIIPLLLVLILFLTGCGCSIYNLSKEEKKLKKEYEKDAIPIATNYIINK